MPGAPPAPPRPGALASKAHPASQGHGRARSPPTLGGACASHREMLSAQGTMRVEPIKCDVTVSLQGRELSYNNEKSANA